MLRYEISIAWSDEDQLYIAEAPELPGCMAHGETYVEAVESIQEAMELWLEVSREFNDSVPEPKGWSLPGSDPIDPKDVPSMETMRMRLEERAREGREKRKRAS